ncbi:MAG: polyprenyl synthetase family protein [Acidobacteria bacterium]|jgi:geranylgeranyl diphosphate synthase type II|nr:MAG: polyprenyl synthetase family protein [Acidobacteriota bacterium]
MSKLAFWKESIETRLRELLKPFEPRLLYEAMSYYVFQEGKRIRPLFVCTVCDALGGDIEDAITVGCAIELLHNYSLVHDDLPIMDNDPIRRGKPSCHVIFGEDIALLAGDGLLTLSFEILSTRENFRSLGRVELLEIIRVLSSKAGYKGMVGGQALDIRELSNRKEISKRKTAELFSACFISGGIIAKRWDLMEKLDALGLQVGLIFQIMDDYRDRDGFYKLYGEKLLEEVEGISIEFINESKSVRIYTEELKNLIDTILCK